MKRRTLVFGRNLGSQILSAPPARTVTVAAAPITAAVPVLVLGELARRPGLPGERRTGVSGRAWWHWKTIVCTSVTTSVLWRAPFSGVHLSDVRAGGRVVTGGIQLEVEVVFVGRVVGRPGCRRSVLRRSGCRCAAGQGAWRRRHPLTGMRLLGSVRGALLCQFDSGPEAGDILHQPPDDQETSVEHALWRIATATGSVLSPG